MTTPSKIQDQITCTICSNNYKSPVQLPCDHTYCIECISTISKELFIQCPQCDKKCTKQECVENKKAQQLITLYATCTDGKKNKTGSKLSFHLPTRSSSRKTSLSEKTKEKKGVFEANNNITPFQENLVEQNRGESTVLTRASPRHSTISSTSSTDSEKELCNICMKHSMKWICMKCNFKACTPCKQNFPLLCKDGTADHIFTESEFFTPECDKSTPTTNSTPTQFTNKAYAHENTESKGSIPGDIKIVSKNNESLEVTPRKVTFQNLDDATESCSDTDFKPHFRDSIALTKDKKESLQEIIDEISKIEETAMKSTSSLKNYHGYMKDIKVAGFNLIDQTEQIMMDKVSQFFSNLRQDYESGVEEMTVISEQIHKEIDENLHEIHTNTALLEEIIDNNDTRAMMDEEFLAEKCEELDTSVAKLGKNIVQCRRTGLTEVHSWDDEGKLQFEKQMNVGIITATENEMKDKLFPEMADSVHKLKPVLGPEQKLTTKKKLFECVIC